MRKPSEATAQTSVPATAQELRSLLQETRAQSLALIEDLDDRQMMGPRLPIVNPLLWEIGHLGWFQERWVLRHLRGSPPLLEHGDALYDSAQVAHDTRWDLPLPSRAETLRYVGDVLQRAGERLGEGEVDGNTAYFYRLAALHEAMHAEAFTYTRQTLSYPAPPSSYHAASGTHPLIAQHPTDGAKGTAGIGSGSLPGDVEVPGGKFSLGATPDEIFVFDNEKWAHSVLVRPFAISRAAVTNGEFAAFTEDGGYSRRELWSDEGWAWREGEGANHPVYWRKEAGHGWQRRVFDRWMPLGESLALIHVNWFEAEAFCRWAKRRLPTETEWEVTAAGEPEASRPSASPVLAQTKRRFPWGEGPPNPARANLDQRYGGVVDVGAFALGDSAFGCRQMIGNVWEWTATPFQPYPGFVADPYKEYSEPWFDGLHRVLRGGCWATRSHLIRNTWRNFYPPDRRDVFAGFRTCAL